jgi:DNA polymerase elongation subunit (family B)
MSAFPLDFSEAKMPYDEGGEVKDVLQVLTIELRKFYTNDSPDGDVQGLVFLVFGRTYRDESVCVRVHGFQPFCYMRLDVADGVEASTAQCEAVRAALARRIRAEALDDLEFRIEEGRIKETATFIVTKGRQEMEEDPGAAEEARDQVVSVVPAPGRFRHDYYTEKPLFGLVKVTVSFPDYIHMLRDMVSCTGLEGLEGTPGGLPADTSLRDETGLTPELYEADWKALLQFMEQADIRGCMRMGVSHAAVARGRELGLHAFTDAMQAAHCVRGGAYDIHIDDVLGASHPLIVGLPGLEERILALDGEMLGTPPAMPDGGTAADLQLQVCTSIGYNNRADVAPERKAFCLGETAGPLASGGEVRCFATEGEMFTSLSEYIAETDPDVISGHNVDDFDLAFIIDRMHFLSSCRLPGVSCPLSALEWGRTRGRAMQSRVVVYETGARGRTENRRASIDGRVVLDTLEAFQRGNDKLRDYKLETIGQTFLGEGKLDMPFGLIRVKWESRDPLQRLELADYCDQDADLVRRLIEKKQLWTGARALTQATGVLPQMTISNGQSVRVETICTMDMRQRPEQFVTVFRPRIGDAAHPDTPYQTPAQKRAWLRRCHSDGVDPQQAFSTPAGGREIGYKGATVVEPERGFHPLRARPGHPSTDAVVVATLDFASLYPTIMRRWNISFDTYLLPATAAAWAVERPKDFHRAPTGHCFVKKRLRVGIVGRVLTHLTAERSAAKKAMFAAEDRGDTMAEANFNGRQLALKVTSNSIYGYTGAERVSRWGRTALAESVTSYGRMHLDATRAKALEIDPTLFTVYGDTDSVMLRMVLDRWCPGHREMDLEQILVVIIPQAKAVCKEITTSLFKMPIDLAFEKIFVNMLLSSMKRYAAMHYEKPTEECGFLDTKGMENKRRDNALLTSELCGAVLMKMLHEGDTDGAVLMAQRTVHALVTGRTDVDGALDTSTRQLVVTKQYTRPEYLAEQPHVNLIKKKRRRATQRVPGAAGPRTDGEFNAPLGSRVEMVYCMSDVVASEGSGAGALSGLSSEATTFGGAEPGKVAKPTQRAETPEDVDARGLQIDAGYYVVNQLVKPLVRMFKWVFPCPPGTSSEEREARVIRLIFGELQTASVPHRGISPTRLPIYMRDAFDPASASRRKATRAYNQENPTKVLEASFRRPAAIDKVAAGEAATNGVPDAMGRIYHQSTLAGFFGAPVRK